MNQLTLKQYCPKTKYGNHIQDIIKTVVKIEDEYNHDYIPAELPKYEKKKIKITLAFIVGFAGNMIRSILP